MLQTKRLLFVCSIVAVCVVLDHATKFAAIYFLRDTGAVYRVLGEYFQLLYAENRGAFLSLGATLPDGIRAMVLTGLNLVILACVLAFLAVRRYLPLVAIWAMALLLAGGIGNIIDRIFRNGVVVDFMLIDTGLTLGPVPLRTGVFNIADLAIVGGLVLLMGHELFGSKQVPAMEDVSEIEAQRPKAPPAGEV
jgi:signal peptidase II